MASVYLVTRGEYSDYSILAAFSTEEGAQAAVAVINQERDTRGAEIEEFELDAFVDHYRRGELLYGVLMFRSGDSQYTYANYAGEERTLFGTDARNGPWLRVDRWATAVETVAKIANELRTQKIAADEWE